MSAETRIIVMGDNHASVFRPFFTYYGGKWRVALKYPAPKHDVIIEPFAGAAGYSIRHYQKQVILIEKNPKIASAWRFLIGASKDDVMSLPLLEQGQSVDDLKIEDGARYAIGLNLNKGAAAPCKRLSSWSKDVPNQFWGEHIRKRMADNVWRIKHWTLIEGDYSNAPDIEATWFVDPPYAIAGSHYPSQVDDYTHLASWCKSRKGQTVVCENEGADWLPFVPFMEIKANNSKHGGKRSKEAIWTNQ